MGWFSSLFVSPGNVDKLVDSAVSAGDKIWFTEEEKADNRNKIMSWYLDLLASMKPFNIAMRVLAVGVFSMWALHITISTLFYVAAFFICANSDCAIADFSALIESQLDKHINDHFTVIIMFYFGAAGVNSALATWKGKDATK